MHRALLSSFVLASVAGSVSAQTELVLCLNWAGNGRYDLTAELLNPTGTIRTIISDLSFTIGGYGFANFTYNPAFDSTFFGPATVSVTSTEINFSGTNTLPPLNNPGGPDSSNPLYIASFDSMYFDSFTINGQFSGAYVGTPFDNVFFYQNANGSPGSVPFSVCIIPAPASATLMGLAGFAAMRRRR